MINILVTGAAGFIGANLVKKILQIKSNFNIVGLDNLNNYYDPSIKEYRLAEIGNIKSKSNFTFFKGDLVDKELIIKLFKEYRFEIVVNLAAQAGVRYSLENPDAYIKSNIEGFSNIVEACRKYPVKHLIYASSSSVYGANHKIPFCEDDPVNNQISLYAKTKRENEILAKSFSTDTNIHTTGLRFFTVYGPAGRPDMAYFAFANKLVKREKISVFNFGNCKRDFTYIDDIVEGIIKIIDKDCENDLSDVAKIYNIGNSNPVNLMDFIHILSEELILSGVLPKKFNVDDYIKLVPMQPGDVEITYADTSKLENDFGFKPKTPLRKGLKAFSIWYYNFYIKEGKRL